MIDRETLAYQHQHYYKIGQQCREFNIGKNQHCDNENDEDYTFAIATVDVQGKHTNNSPHFFRIRSNSISFKEELSPADSFFSNGHHLPHSFPSIVSTINISRAPSDLFTKEFLSSSLGNSSSRSSSRNSRQNSSGTSSRVNKQVGQLKSPRQSRGGDAQRRRLKVSLGWGRHYLVLRSLHAENAMRLSPV